MKLAKTDFVGLAPASIIYADEIVLLEVPFSVETCVGASAPDLGAEIVLRRREAEKMKYAAFWTVEPEHMEKVTELQPKLVALLADQRTRARFPKEVSGNYIFCGQYKGLHLFEVENPDQMTALSAYYAPYMK